MKNPFANFTIAITGEFGAAKPADIQRWVEAAGGAFASKVDKKVTHLVSSWKDYKARVAKGMCSNLVDTLPASISSTRQS
jgi:NAD-dependent DNA ligase